MTEHRREVELAIGTQRCLARFDTQRAPRACAHLAALLPLRGELVHARWSGEGCWVSLVDVWPTGLLLDGEARVSEPEPGEILLYAGALSTPELFLPYGATRFASVAGRLAGSPVLRVVGSLATLADIGNDVLRRGACPISIAAVQGLEQENKRP
jgi:hypothetical protein